MIIIVIIIGFSFFSYNLQSGVSDCQVKVATTEHRPLQDKKSHDLRVPAQVKWTG